MEEKLCLKSDLALLPDSTEGVSAYFLSQEKFLLKTKQTKPPITEREVKEGN